MLHFWAVIIKTICPYTNYVKNKTKMFIFNLFSSAFLIFNFLRFLPCILLQRLFYYGSEAIEWFILLKYCVNTFDFSLATYLDLVLTKKNRTKLSFIQCTVRTLQGVRVSERSFYLGWGTFCNLRAETKTKCRIIEPQPHRVHDLFDHLEKNFIMSGILVSQLVFHLKRDSVNQSVRKYLSNVNISNIQYENVGGGLNFLGRFLLSTLP